LAVAVLEGKRRKRFVSNVGAGSILLVSTLNSSNLNAGDTTGNVVDPMLSFDISAIDIVLLVVVMVLIVLFITQQRGKTVAESPLPPPSLGENLEKLETRVKSKSKEHNTRQSPLDFTKCIHDFGYLRNLPQNTPIPDECFGCPQVMRCLFPNEQDQIVH